MDVAREVLRDFDIEELFPSIDQLIDHLSEEDRAGFMLNTRNDFAWLMAKEIISFVTNRLGRLYRIRFVERQALMSWIPLCPVEKEVTADEDRKVLDWHIDGNGCREVITTTRMNVTSSSYLRRIAVKITTSETQVYNIQQEAWQTLTVPTDHYHTGLWNASLSFCGEFLVFVSLRKFKIQMVTYCFKTNGWESFDISAGFLGSTEECRAVERSLNDMFVFTKHGGCIVNLDVKVAQELRVSKASGYTPMWNSINNLPKAFPLRHLDEIMFIRAGATARALRCHVGGGNQIVSLPSYSNLFNAFDWDGRCLTIGDPYNIPRFPAVWLGVLNRPKARATWYQLGVIGEDVHPQEDGVEFEDHYVLM